VLLEENVQRYTKGLYPMVAMLVLVPLADLALRSYPAQFGTLQWRFGTAGLLLGNYGTILLGLGLLGLVAAIQGHRGILRGLDFGAITLAVITLALLVSFTFDAIQIRALAQAGFKRQILTSSVGALFTGLLGTLALVVLGRAALAASRVTRGVASSSSTRAKAPAPSPLVVGSAAPSATGAREAV
jgi:hypothetical protein